MTQLHYRGVVYDNARHEQPSPTPIEHSYRGHHYLAPLNHEAAAVNTAVELSYRGHHYHHTSPDPSTQG